MFVPKPDSDAVHKRRKHLGVEKGAVRVKIAASESALERNCYVNVKAKVEKDGGRSQLGWAVWQMPRISSPPRKTLNVHVRLGEFVSGTGATATAQVQANLPALWAAKKSVFSTLFSMVCGPR